MTWNPIFPAALVILAIIALAGFAIWCAVRARGAGRRLTWPARAGVAVLIGIACLRPGIGSAAAPTVERAIDVVFVVDTTASMVAEDWDGDKPRLEGVRADIMALAEDHPGARFALITFDSEAVERLPFTVDTSALQATVEALRPEMTKYSRGSSIGRGAALLQDVLERAKDKDESRLRIAYYLGDGEQTATQEPESFERSAPLLAGGAVLGYGTSAGGRMTTTGSAFSTEPPEYIRDSSGADARSVIDEANLQTIASELGVAYELRAAGAPPQPAAVDASKVPSQRSGDVETAFELYWIFAIAAFAVLLADVWRTSRTLRELRDSRGALDDD